VCPDLGGCSPSLYEAQGGAAQPFRSSTSGRDDESKSVRSRARSNHARNGDRGRSTEPGVEGHVLGSWAPRRCRVWVPIDPVEVGILYGRVPIVTLRAWARRAV
jgi:hypothetical protein